jgi:dUTP pyrophosphatase
MEERVKVPTFATAGSAGIDLQVNSFDGARLQGRATIPPGNAFTVGTGLKVHIGSYGEGLVGMVFPRSSLGKRGLALQNTVGIIDEDYQGEIVLMCRNTGKQILFLDPGERIAQMVVVPVFRPEMVRVKKFEETARGEDGFGSTGK